MNYFLYYAGFNSDTEEEQVGVAKSKDLVNWNYINNKPVVPIGSQGIFDNDQTSNPCVLKHNGLYKMWYQGKSKDGLISICYAESKDGITWTPSKDPVFFPYKQETSHGYRDGFHHPHVVYDEKKNLFKMWFVFYKNNLTSFYYAESVNGLVWNDLEETNVTSTSEKTKYWYPFVLQENGLYRMWFTERRSNKMWLIHHAISKDGLNWDLNFSNPVIKKTKNIFSIFLFETLAKFFNQYFDLPIYGIGSPFVLKKDDRYFLFGHEVGPRGKLYISKYESLDGLNWKKKINNILSKPDSKWNDFFQGDPYLYVE